MKNAESQHTDGPGRGRSRAIRRIKSGIAGGRDGHLCPMGSLDPRRCATPQAVAKLKMERPVAASLREEESDPGMKASGAQVTPRAGGWSVRVSGTDGFQERKPEQHDLTWDGGTRPRQMVRG